jgi:LPS-assembly protein
LILQHNMKRLARTVAALALAVSLAPEASAIVKKKLVEPITSSPKDGTKANFVSDQVIYDPRTKTATALGEVRITYGPYVLIASKVVYNEVTGDFSANGSVELREKNGNILKAKQVFLTNKFKEGFARHLQALLTNDASIRADYAERKEGRITIYQHARYTACTGCETKKGDPLWEIVTTKTVHDEEAKTLYHTNPRLKIAGITVAGLPYAEQPDPTVKRRTGILPPSYKFGDYYGFGPITPYYWALAPNYDLTFSPLWSFKQGPVADLEWRHRLSNGTYKVRGYGTYQFDLQNRDDTDRRWRGALTSTGNFKVASDWTMGWDGIVASDKTFLRNYDFNRSVIGYNDLYVTGLWDQTYIDVRGLHHVALSKSVDWDTLPTAVPYISGEHIFADPFIGGELKANWSSYTLWRDEPDTPFAEVNHGTQQSRAILDLRWKKQAITDLGQVITPFARVRSDVYVSDVLPDASVPGGLRDQETTLRVLPSVGIDMRWPFIADQFGGQGILTPVAQVIVATDETETEKIGNEDAITLNFDHSSLFLDDRFTGLDRYEGGTRANLGLSYAYYGDNGGSLRASIGESFHIAGENSFDASSGLDGAKSDLVGAISASPVSWLNLSYQGRLEEDLSEFNRHEALLGLSFDRITAQAGYQFIDAEPLYGRERVEEFLFASGRYQLSEGWYAFGGMRYDLESDFMRQQSIGVEFDCDCMNAKLSYSRSKSSDTAEAEHRVLFSIDLATLGGTSFSSRF